MHRSRSYARCAVLLAAVLAGCMPQQPFYLHDNHGDLAHYLGMATQIEPPDVNERPLDEVTNALRPLSLANAEAKEIWDMRLESAVRCALENSKVFRSIGNILGAPNLAPAFLTQNADAAMTVFDPALVESNARTGVEAALSAFDAQWNTALFWEKNHIAQNISPLFAEFEPMDFAQDLAQFQTSVQKTAANGAVVSVQHTVAYDMDNSLRAFPADWTANLQVQIRQPLLQGAGVEFNRIAGPGAVPGVNNGVVLARINTDIALADFEASVRNLVNDVETAYWELYFAYRNLDTMVAGRNSALETWRRVHELFLVGAKGGEADKEAQAREQYFLFRGQVETALRDLYAAEGKLRYILGLAATDGRLIRPADEPTTAKVAFDWADTHAEAQSRSVELRRQRWRLKQRELELVAARNFLLPRIDVVAKYTWMGMGEQLTGTEQSDPAGYSSAYHSLFHGDYQSWHLGFEASVPLGFRKEMAGVRNAELSLTRERAKLQDEELEISHQVAFAIRDVESDFTIAQTAFNRRVAAQREVDAVKAAYDTGMVTFDVLLQTQRTLADAESSYYRTLVSYNEAIATVHFRKGSLLEYNGVYLTEGPWPGKAYFDARRRARARDAAHYLNYCFTLPKAIALGPYNQWADARTQAAAAPPPAPATGAAQPETMPTPAPQPAAEPAPTGQPAPAAKSGDQARLPLLPPDDAGPRGGYDLIQDEPPANPPPAQADRPAPGWTGVQR